MCKQFFSHHITKHKSEHAWFLEHVEVIGQFSLIFNSFSLDVGICPIGYGFLYYLPLTGYPFQHNVLNGIKLKMC